MLRNAQSLPLITGLLLSLGFALLIYFAPLPGIAAIRETVFDALIQLRLEPVAPEVVVVDIDETSDGAGEAAWSRSKTAALVERLAAAGSAVVAFDLVFSAFCEPDTPGNAELAAAMAKLPVVLGFFLNDRNEGAPAPLPPLAVRTPMMVPDLWFSASAEKSCVQFETVAAGTGVASLAGDNDARIRVAPAVVVVADAGYPGLALEALRIGKAWPVPVFGGDPPIFRLGSLSVPVDSGGNLRLRPTASAVWAARTVTAVEVLAGTADGRLEGAIVFVGSSQPEMGGLRATATSPLEPSVQIHADIATALLAGIVPFRDPGASLIEALAAGLAGAVVTLLALWWRPAIVFPIAAGLAAAWVGAVGGIYWSNAMLFDPLYPAGAVLIVYAVTSIVRYAATLRAEETLRRRFGQHLPPALVTRFVENPSLLKLEGEERMVTALFTDIEGFTATTKLAGPRELIAMLDGYLGGIAHIVTSHGGVVDKFVGDAVHAFFNAPLDLDGHADKAIAAAIEIAAFGEAFRGKPENARFAFGRTRIGIESGLAVVGDVGSGEKIDYTAHGNAVNLASRLEGANKELGTAICVGPGAKAGATVPLTSLGEIEVRGFGRLEVFSPELPSGQSPTLA